MAKKSTEANPSVSREGVEDVGVVNRFHMEGEKEKGDISGAAEVKPS